MNAASTAPPEPALENPPEVAAPSPSSSATTSADSRHRPHEDVQALITGTLFVALGVTLFGEAGLLTGGTAGLAFLIRYATGMDFGLAFFLVNLPFYVFAWQPFWVACCAATAC